MITLSGRHLNIFKMLLMAVLWLKKALQNYIVKYWSYLGKWKITVKRAPEWPLDGHSPNLKLNLYLYTLGMITEATYDSEMAERRVQQSLFAFHICLEKEV